MIEVKKKEGETSSALLYRFTKKMRQSGVLIETRKRRFRDRNVNKRKRRIAAQYRTKKQTETARLKKMGLL